MRLCFPNNEHDDVLIARGDTGIGSAPDNAIVLNTAGVASHHVSLNVQERSVVLHVCDAKAQTHVNARPVREMALLRLGDCVSLDSVCFLLKPDRDDNIRTQVPAQAAPAPVDVPTAARRHELPSKVVLRGVSGSYFGKVVPVRGRLVIGRDADCDLVLDEPDMAHRHAQIESAGDGIFLRDLGSAHGTCVNGVQVRDAVLHTDDQITFDRNRFLLEAPSLPVRDDHAGDASQSAAGPMVSNITQTLRAIPKSGPSVTADETTARNKNDVWWLIAAAALIALGLAVLLFVRF